MSTPRTDWQQLFGLTKPAAPIRADHIPDVPHALYGIKSHTGTPEQRRAKRDKRMTGEVEYLREYGEMSSEQLAKAFGISQEAMINDLRLLQAEKRIRRANQKKPFLWEAA